MKPRSHAPSRSRARTFSLVVAFGMLATASLILVHGWLLGNDMTARVMPQFRAMVPSTAFCFALLAVAFILLLRPRRHLTACAISGLVALIATICLVNLATVFFLGGTGIDALFRQATFQTDRMSILTSFGLLVCAGCVVTMLTLRSHASEVMTSAALLGLSTGLTLIAGQAFDPGRLYELAILDGMSVPSACLFTLFFAAVLLLQLQPEP